MDVQAFFDPVTSTLTYVVFDAATGDALIIDPVLDYDPNAVVVSEAGLDRVVAFVAGRQLTVHWVLETHVHADHLSGAARLRERLGARIAIHEAVCEVQRTWKAIFGWSDDVPTDGSQWDALVVDGVPLRAGAIEVRPIHVPGHTPACVCYCIGDAVFTGDSLFLPDMGTGRCDFPGGSAAQLYDSIQRIHALPDRTRVFVGHDYQPAGRALAWESTVGASRAGNVHLPPGITKEQFVAFRSQRDATLKPPALLFPALQVNAIGGRLPEPRSDGRRFLVLPMDALSAPSGAAT